MKRILTILIGLIGLALFVPVAAAVGENAPYQTLSVADKALLQPQIERWIRDQLRHDWADLWEIQDQTPELKNELLSGQRNAPNLDRNQYAQAMKGTIGVGYPEIKGFRLIEVDRESDGFQVVGCANLEREEWKQTSVQYIHVRVAGGKVLFAWPDGSADECNL